MTIVWDGLTYKLKCLTNPATTHGTINTLRKSELSDLSFTRPDWNSTVNEIRAEFVDANRGYRGNLVEVKDAGSIAQQGGRVSTNRVSLTAVTDYNTARKIAARILVDSAYPAASISFKMSRFKSQLEIGDVFRLIWDEFNSTTVTGYYICVARSGDASAEDMISITAREDISIPAVASEETSIAVPDAEAWEKKEDLDVTDVDQAEDIPLEDSELVPIMAFEFPPIATAGTTSHVVLLAQRVSTSVLGIQYLGERDGKTLKVLGEEASFAIGGAIKTDFTDLTRMNRTAAGFEFQLVNPSRDEASLLSTFSKVDAATNDMEELVEDEIDYMVVGEELFHIGKVEKIATNHYRARNFLRGVMDSRIKPYTAGTPIFFVAGAMHEGVDVRSLQADQITNFRGYPIGSAGRVVNLGSDIRIEHTGKIVEITDADERLVHWGIRALPPTIKEVTDGGSTLTFTLRPRWFDRGAGIRGGRFADQMTRIQESLDNLRFQYQQFDSSLTALDQRRNFVLSSFTPDQFGDPDTGVAIMSPITKVAGVSRILVWGVQNEQVSLDRSEYQL